MSRKKDQLNGNLALLILSVLDDGPLHGYGIARAIEAKSADALKFGEGAIYPCLRKLEDNNFATCTWDTAGPGPAKKVYALTAEGHQELAKNRADWQDYVNLVNKVIQPASAGLA